MKLIGISLLFLAFFGRCSPDGEPLAELVPTNGLIIRTGSSFGMCVGYCVNDYAISGTAIRLTQNGYPKTQYSTRVCQSTISQSRWDALRAAANLDVFSKQPERIGCPDCADGGAEYVELEMDGKTHRVTFEYGGTIPGLEPLIDSLRAQRAAFKDCE